MQSLEKILQHELLPLFIVAIVIALCIYLYRHSTRYIRFEAKLPTSKIGSLTVGLVEVRGRIAPIETVTSPHFNKECIGYHYKIEKIKRNSDREDTYSEKYQENTIQEFLIADETGSVRVDPEKLVARKLKTDSDYEGDYRYSQSVLRNGDRVVIIGRVRAVDGNLVLGHDSHHDIFSLIPIEQMNQDAKLSPILRSVNLLLFVMLTSTALILSYHM